MMKRIAILGSTGSIGQSALKVIRHLKEQFQVKALVAKNNIDLLEIQAKEFQPEIIAVENEEKAKELKKRLSSFRIVSGTEGINEAATYPDVDLVLSAMVGFAGILPTVHAIKARKQIALANKEVMVAAGEYVRKLADQYQVPLIPVDSEHSAIFQCLQGAPLSSVQRVILTASGGPFLNRPLEELKNVTVDEALTHPNWRMGAKVTVDCTTLMNKGLEVIEAHHLFNIPIEKIQVLIHPQSIVHSFVEYIDRTMLAQLAIPQMTIPIQYALTYPEKRESFHPPFDFTKNSTLNFYLPDPIRFPCLGFAYTALEEGGSMPCYLNASNEVLVERFIKGNISWKEIAIKLEKLIGRHHVNKMVSLEEIFEVDAMARAEAINI